jgi:hypothetical protein
MLHQKHNKSQNSPSSLSLPLVKKQNTLVLLYLFHILMLLKLYILHEIFDGVKEENKLSLWIAVGC